jgi:hypothetical protein
LRGHIKIPTSRYNNREGIERGGVVRDAVGTKEDKAMTFRVQW